MNFKLSIFKDVLIFFLVCLLIFLAAAGVFISWVHFTSFGLNVSKDSKLIAIFRAHETAFEELQQMATDDAQYGWYFNSPYFEGSKLDEAYRQEYEKDPRYAWYFNSPYFEGGTLKDARRNKYKNLVSEISPNLAIDMDYNGTIRFDFAGGETSAIDGPEWVKGIEYVSESHVTNGAVYCGEWKVEDVTNPPQWQGLLLTNLDNVQTLAANVYLRPIETNWFIFYQQTDN